MGTVRVRVFADSACHDVDPAQLPELLKNDQTIWVDLTGPDEAGAAILRNIFQFHPLAVEDTMNHRQRPKVEEYTDYLFVIANPAVSGEIAEFRELDLFLGRNFLVTAHVDAEPVIGEAERRVGTRTTGPNVTAAYLFYILIDIIVDGYLPMLDAFGDLTEAVEDQIIAGPGGNSLEELVSLRRQIRQVARVVSPQRDMFNVLTRRDLSYINHDDLEFYFRDVYDHLLRINDMLATYRDTITGAEDLSMSAFSNRLGLIVNRLTVITIITGVSAAVSGFYGMNFEFTWPPHEAIWGVPVVIALMIGIATALIAIFRRAGWFG